MSEEDFNTWDEEEEQGGSGYYEDKVEDFTFTEEYLAYTSQMKLEDLIRIGHELKDMLVDCTFNGRRCSPA